MNLRRLGAAALCLIALASVAPATAQNAPTTEKKPAVTAQKPEDKEKAAKAEPKMDSRTAYNEGAKLMSKKDWQGALNLFNVALQSNEGFVKAHVFRGVCLFMLDNPRKALAALDRALEYDPENPEGLFYRGQVYFFLGDSKTATKDYDRFLALDPENGPARLQKAMAQFRLGNHESTITEASRAISANPKNADAFAVRGGAFWQKDMLGAARDDFQAAAALRPDSGTFQLLSFITRTLTQDPSAKADLGAWAEKAPNREWPYPAVQMMLGKATPPEVVKAAASVPDQPYLKDLSEAQAQFYIAWLYKLNGNQAKFDEHMAKANLKGQLYMIQGLVKYKLDKAY